MAFEMMVGLNVTNEEGYQAYRDGMTPLLQEYGGGFRYDFNVATTLKSEAAHPITRIFAIYFKDEESKTAFFRDPKYKEVKNKFLPTSVDGITQIAAYSR